MSWLHAPVQFFKMCNKKRKQLRLLTEVINYDYLKVKYSIVKLGHSKTQSAFATVWNKLLAIFYYLFSTINRMASSICISIQLSVDTYAKMQLIYIPKHY